MLVSSSIMSFGITSGTAIGFFLALVEPQDSKVRNTGINTML